MNHTGENNTLNGTSTVPAWLITHRIIATVLGILAVFVNVITIIVISKSKELRTPCFILIAGSAFGSLLGGVVYAFANTRALGEWNGHWSRVNRPRSDCLFLELHALICFVSPYAALTVSLIAIDRLLCSTVPVWYRNLGNGYAIIGLAASALFSIAESCILILSDGPLSRLIPACTLLQGLGRDAFTALYKINVTMNIFCVLCYLAMIIGSYVRKWKVNNEQHGGFANANELQQFLRRTEAILPAIRMLAILYIVAGVVPSICLTLVTSDGLLYYIGFQIKQLTIFVEFVSLTWRCEAFRGALVKLFKLKNIPPPVLTKRISKETN